jgi:hypothetical protein
MNFFKDIKICIFNLYLKLVKNSSRRVNDWSIVDDFI